jgi:hypothetical protein
MNKTIWKVFPPYIDAYKMHYNDNKETSFSEFKKALKSNAIEWAEHSIGKQFLNGKVIIKNGYFIIGCGWYNTTEYLVYIPMSKDIGYLDWDKMKIVKEKIPDKFNVT